MRGSDGNYFLCALLPALLVSMRAATERSAETPRVGRVIVAGSAAIAVFQALVSFTPAGWYPGTRAFDLDFDRTWRDGRRERAELLERAGLTHIAAYLAEQRREGASRAVGIAREPASFYLPIRFEHLLTISYSRPQYFDDADAFIGFLRDQRIRYLVLPIDVADAVPSEIKLLPQPLRDAIARLEREPGVREIRDRTYRLIDFGADSALSQHSSSPESPSVTPP